LFIQHRRRSGTVIDLATDLLKRLNPDLRAQDKGPISVTGSLDLASRATPVSHVAHRQQLVGSAMGVSLQGDFTGSTHMRGLFIRVESRLGRKLFIPATLGLRIPLEAPLEILIL
jgi:hypothetical protein